MRRRGHTAKSMGDGTRLIFWIDVLVLIVLAILVVAGQWDWVIALFVALVFLNYFDRWREKRR
jgi:hypothetical protein